MNPVRFLDEDRVDMDLDTSFDEEHPVDVEALAAHMATLLERSPDVVNATRLRNELVQCERRAPSLLGHRVAMPHVRTLQARKPILAIGLSRAGLELPTPDSLPVALVIALVGPTYDDRVYLQLYKALGEKLEHDGWVDAVLEAEQPGEVLRALSR